MTVMSGSGRLVGIGLVGAAAVGIALAIYFLSVTPAPLSTVKSFVASVEVGKIEAAYSTLHADLRRRQSYDEFMEAWEVRSNSLSRANRFWSTDVDNETADVEGRFSTPDGEEWSAVFKLIKEDDLWQIIDYEVVDGLFETGPGG